MCNSQETIILLYIYVLIGRYKFVVSNVAVGVKMIWKFDALVPSLDAKFQHVTELPPVPEVARAILALKDDPQANAHRLGRTIELDPGLAATIVRYATSASFSYRGKIESIQDAVSRVLGFDKAMHIALGLAAGRSLRHTKEGPIGVKAFWRHAIFSASLMQYLALQMPARQRPAPGLVYLAGLVHNIGFLLMGHLLEAEFNVLNKASMERPTESIIELEAELLDLSHTDLGVWLLRKWKMPAEVLVTVFSHHNEHYQGDHAAYANLALVADRLLKRHAIGDAASMDLPTALLNTLGFTEAQAESMLNRLQDEKEGLDTAVASIIAQR